MAKEKSKVSHIPVPVAASAPKPSILKKATKLPKQGKKGKGKGQKPKRNNKGEVEIHREKKGEDEGGERKSSGQDDGEPHEETNSESDLRREERLRHRLLESKLREEYIQTKHAERLLYRRKLIKTRKRVQDELEYLHFPTLAGLYFDGFHLCHFILRKQWADIFNELEEINTRQNEIDRHETWEELVKRNFWPPRVYGRIFRTRGIYLDYPEVMRDPPRTPPDPNRGKGEGEGAGEGEGEGEGKEGEGDFHKRTKCIPKKYDAVKSEKPELGKYDYYFDEDVGAFLPIGDKDPDMFYFDCRFGIWRLKRPVIMYANDFYYDSDNGEFFPKDRAKVGMYYYDQTVNVWKMRENNGPPCNGLYPRDYFFNELYGKWIYRGDAPSEKNKKQDSDASATEDYAFDENGKRFAKRIPITGPDDFYFDETGVGIFRLKDEGDAKSYAEGFGAWRKSGAENKDTKLKPSDYYWLEGGGVFTIKDGPRMVFEFDAKNKFFRKKKLLRGKHHPSNWRWNIKTKQWELKKNNRSYFFTEVLNWKPERSYEKPWLDSDSLNRTYINMQSYNKAVSEMAKADGEKQKTGEWEKEKTDEATAGKPVVPINQPAKMVSVSTKEPPYGKCKLDLALMKAMEAEWGDKDFKNHPNRISFDKPAALNLMNFHSVQPEKGVSLTKLQQKRKVDSHGNLILDKAIDRKRLRCGNLGGMVHETELKSFFYAAIAVDKPINREAGDTDDFLYIQFPSDIAASAAFRVMQHADIKGQIIELSYPRRDQK